MGILDDLIAVVAVIGVVLGLNWLLSKAGFKGG